MAWRLRPWANGAQGPIVEFFSTDSMEAWFKRSKSSTKFLSDLYESDLYKEPHIEKKLCVTQQIIA